MSKKITEMRTVTSLRDADMVTGIDLLEPDLAKKNIQITKANLLTEYALDTDVAAVASDLSDHKTNPVKTDHTDAVDVAELNSHKSAANQHPISGVTLLQTTLDEKEDIANLGNAAYRDVGTLNTDVAAGDAPAAAVTDHNNAVGAHGGNLPTTNQKAALDGAATALSGANPVVSEADDVQNGSELGSDSELADRILVSDGLGGFIYENKPASGGDPTDLATVYDASGDFLTITSSTAQPGGDAIILAAAPSGDAGVMTGTQAQKLSDQPDQQVSAPEKTAGTELLLRTFSPKDVADMAGIHGGGGGGEINDGANVGTGTDIFKAKNGLNLEFHRIGNTATVEATLAADTVSLAVPANTFDAFGAAAAVQSNLDTHVATVTGNPHGVTKADVGLGNADNTSDADKPISTATQSALDNKLDASGGLIANYGEDDNNLGNVAGTANLDTADGVVQYGTMTDDTTFTLINSTGHNATSMSFLMASGGFTATFSGVIWAGATPDLSANATYLLAFFLINATWYGVLAG